MSDCLTNIISLAIGLCAFGIVSQKMIALGIDLNASGKKLKVSVFDTGVFPFKGKLRTFLVAAA